MHLRELTIRGYRSFAHDPGITLKDLRSTNLILGPNDVGKSNVVRFLTDLRKFIQAMRETWKRPENAPFMPLDCGLGQRDTWLQKGGLIEAELTIEVRGTVAESVSELLVDG